MQRGLGRLLKIRQTSSETFQNHSFTRIAPQAEWPQGHGAGHSTLRQERPPFPALRPQLAVGVCAVGRDRTTDHTDQSWTSVTAFLVAKPRAAQRQGGIGGKRRRR